MWRNTKIVARIDEMIGDAIEGTFSEKSYDETELSRLESKFRQYLMMKETAIDKVETERAAIKSLVSDISHQTKTPLANVLLYTQLLEEQCAQEELLPYVRQIQTQAEKLEFLIQSLIKISRLESGMIALTPTEQPLAPLIEKCICQAKGRAAEKGIRLEAQTAADIRAFYDERWTAEALGNLLDNAVKYSPQGSRVTVRVQAYEMFVHISVEDEGPGIPEEESAQIFERFYRGRNAAGEEGSGIGLYLTRMILQKERAYIKVSPAENGGSCFQMYLLRA